MPARHLGLHDAQQVVNAEEIINSLASKVTENLDVNKLFSDTEISFDSINSLPIKPKKLTMGLARDAAFQFYYPDNLEIFVSKGFEIVEFSPLKDKTVPQCDFLYFGGGYPEVYAEELSQNYSMINSIREFENYIYGECGGLMYLSQAVSDVEGRRFPMAGVLPFETEMLVKRKMLGYMTTTLKEDCFWGSAGTQIRGHEFHYSQITEENNSWETAYSVKGRRKTSRERSEGWFNGKVLASYVHQHFASNTTVIDNLIDYISKS